MKKINITVLAPWIGVFVLLVLIAAVFHSMTRFSDETSKSQLELQQRAVEQASIQCYVIEGYYPPSLAYLEQRYGLILDRKNFYYHYYPFASNIRPDIRVVPVGAGAQESTYPQ